MLERVASLSSTSLAFMILFMTSFACISLLLVYRLLLSPIACFPGSKLTAVTGWYETYLDVFKGGQFTFQIEKWHEKYGQLFYQTPEAAKLRLF